jgi:hypothetical protein
MKRLLLIICLAVITMGCKKSGNPKPQGVVGKWELSLEVGGIAGITNHYAPGNGNILLLNSNNTYQRYKQGALIYQGTYQVVKSSITVSTSIFDGIFFDHNTVGEVIDLQGDALTIGIDYNDQIASSYIRNN